MSALEEILRYMIAGGVSVFLTVWAASWLQYIPWGIDWRTFNDWCGSPMFVLNYLLLSFVVSVLVGSIWTSVTNFFGQKANWLKMKLGINLSLNEPLLIKLFADNKDHFLIIRKNDLDVGVGFFNAIQYNRQDHLEIDIVD